MSLMVMTFEKASPPFRFLAMETSSGTLAPFGTYRARVILGVVVAFAASSTVSLLLRFVGKRIKKTPPSSEDWVIIAAQIAVYALAVVTILEVVLGNAGRHMSEAPSKAPNGLKLLLAVQCLYSAAVGLINISICLFYNRIFAFRSFQIASWTVIIVVLVWATALILCTFFLCRPLAFYWNRAIPGGSCVSHPVMPYIVLGALDVALDITILVLPLPSLWKLRIRLAQKGVSDKIAVAAVFGAGICTTAMSILRIEALAKFANDDVSHTSVYVLVWSFIEPALGISVACAPFFRPLIRRAFKHSDLDSGIELGISTSKFNRMKPQRDSLPIFANPDIRVARGNGMHGPFVTTQVLELGNWSTASRHDGG
ncbi:hypothetical protein K504DRAFT_497544 [Pleomassaria siparia CBS 279.74]|uniref:Rhodopsin domain-containing protein n=1 Tax=Pleomassaria siparia CBS 279.74 TaxID=1314801 RepID=A0A6G1KS41_9PLEO|nr:hypothetical protein K504DRAFT_497544 [Pleomassaria siparia CBS 279.74]